MGSSKLHQGCAGYDFLVVTGEQQGMSGAWTAIEMVPGT